ncbi:MAG: VWA domain-containing protein [Bacteroidetes bacterium]|nr:VWA domain-containing protein [Bacteroidota bacterium]
MKKLKVLFLAFLLAFHLSPAQKAVEEKKEEPMVTRILFIFDASQSMWANMGSERKIVIAQRLLSAAIDSLRNLENVQVALRVYGNRVDINKGVQDCEDTHLEVPFEKDNIDKIKHVLKSTQPKGTTLIARSLEATQSDFPPCANCRNVVILITDGIEACDGDPCAVSRALQQNGVILKPFIIGLGNGKEYDQYFRCIGEYYDASNANSFKTILSVVISEALSSTTCQVNLLDVNQKPIETNVTMTFYDKNSGEVKYNLIHTMNSNGNPDTISLDPIATYNIVVHTKPEMSKENVRLKPGQHNIISIDAPQGSLYLKSNGNLNNQYNFKCVMKQNGKAQIINVQDFEKTEKYIVGEYEVEILTIPRIITTVQISQSNTSKIEVPQPGKVSFNALGPGYCFIYQMVDGKLKLIYELNTEQPNETIYMLPGTYKIVYRAKGAKRTMYSVEKEFKVESGKSSKVDLF